MGFNEAKAYCLKEGKQLKVLEQEEIINNTLAADYLQIRKVMITQSNSSATRMIINKIMLCCIHALQIISSPRMPNSSQTISCGVTQNKMIKPILVEVFTLHSVNSFK